MTTLQLTGGALALVLLVAVPGTIMAAAFRKRGGFAGLGPQLFEQLYIIVVLGFLLDGWLALTLAEFGLFSALNLILAVLAVCALFGVAFRIRPRDLRGLLPWDRLSWVHPCLVAAAVMMIVITGEPFVWVLGGDDSGTYVNTGAHISRTGAIEIYDEVTREAAAAPAGTFFYNPNHVEDPLYSRLPYRFQFIGFFIADETTGEITSQGLHLLPVWVAIFHAFLGFPAGLYLFPLLALLSVVGVFQATRRMLGAPTAAVATLFLSASFLELWFARYPTSEMLVQATLFAALYLFAVAEESDGCLPAALSAFAFSSLLFIRVDTIFVPVLVGLYIVIASIGKPTVAHRHVWFIAAMIPWSTQALLHVFYLSRAYLVYGGMYNFYVEGVAGQEKQLEASLTIFFGLLAAFVVLTALTVRFWRPIGAGLHWLSDRVGLVLRILIALGVVGLLAYAYHWRPDLLPEFGGRDAPQHPDGASLIKLGWYVSELGLALAAIGTVLMTLRARGSALLLLFLGLLYGVIYLYTPLQFALQPQWARKFMPVVVPFTMIAAAHAVAAVAGLIWRKAGRVPAVVIGAVPVVAMVVLTGRLNLPFVDFVEYDGAVEGLARVARLIPEDDAVVLMPRDHIGLRFGQPLRYLEGRNVVLVERTYDPNALREQVAAWHESGRPVYLAAPPQVFRRLFALEQVGEESLLLQESVRPTDRPAGRHYEINVRIQVFRVLP